jgi:hypothetical protein
MREIILHADRGPSLCMDLALEDIFPEATMRSCAFHVMRGLERNGHMLERAMFYALCKTMEPSGYANTLADIQRACPGAYEYILNSFPEQYCGGHPDYVAGMNCCVLNSQSESEFARAVSVRKLGGDSLLALVSGCASLYTVVMNTWVKQINVTAGPKTALLQLARTKLQEMHHLVNKDYQWANGDDAQLDLILSTGGTVSMKSAFTDSLYTLTGGLRGTWPTMSTQPMTRTATTVGPTRWSRTSSSIVSACLIVWMALDQCTNWCSFARVTSRLATNLLRGRI